MKTTTITSYNYNELSKEAREKARELCRDINVGYDGWADFIIDEYKEKLDNLGYDNTKIYYDGFYSQGDGACFMADVNIEKWILTHKVKTRFKKLLDELKRGIWANIVITHSSNYYYATSTNVNSEASIDMSDKAYKQLDEVVEWVKEEREKMGNELYRELEKEYYYLISDEAVSETIRVNEYQFTKNGDRNIYL